MPYTYTTPLIVPSVSSVDQVKGDANARSDINYILNGLRALAMQLDKLTGNTQFSTAQLPSIPPQLSITANSAGTFYVQASVDIHYGAFVNLYNSTPTTVLARPASANAVANLAGGFCVQTGGIPAGQWGAVCVGPGINYGLSGMLPGTWYYLSPAIGGLLQVAQPATPNFVQICGQALTDSVLNVGSLNNWYPA